MPHATDVNTAQDPEKSWSRVPVVERLEPIEDNAIWILVFAGVNLYHTSSSGSPVIQPVGIPLLAVASHTVPELFVAPLERVVAPAQSSFAGGVGIGV